MHVRQQDGYTICNRNMFFFGATLDTIIDNPDIDINWGFPLPSIYNSTRQTLLSLVCEIGDIDLIKKCLAKGANPNIGYLFWDEDGSLSVECPLHRAVSGKQENFLETANILIEAGAIFTQKDLNDILIESLYPLNLKSLKWSLINGADPNYVWNDMSPLMLLAHRWNHKHRANYIDAAVLLIQNGADQKYKSNPYGPKWNKKIDIAIYPKDYGVWDAEIRKITLEIMDRTLPHAIIISNNITPNLPIIPVLGS